MMMQYDRTCEITVSRNDGDADIEMAISSETPVERWFGIEILSHDPGAVDLSRLGDGRHPLLLNHEGSAQIGVITKAWIDSGDRRLRGAVKFSRSQLGQEISQDVRDGIRSLVSVGYFIDEIQEMEKSADGSLIVKREMTGEEFRKEMRAFYGDDFYRACQAAARSKASEPPVFIVTRWQPFEASIVPVPADASVGIGRSVGAECDRGDESQERHIIMTTENDIMVEKTVAVEKTAAEKEIERRDQIAAIGEQYVARGYITDKDVAEAIRGACTVDAFKDTIMQKMESRHTDTSALHIGLTRTEARRYSLGRALVAQLTGDWSKAGFERECSREMERIVGAAPEGFFVPLDIFKRAFSVGTSTEAGNLVATEMAADLFVDALRNAMVMGALGVRFLPGLTANLDLPRKSAAGTIGMLTEIAAAAATAPTTAKATLSPHRLGAYTEVSKQALIQAAVSVENLIRDDLLTGAGVLLENQAINGTGAGAEIKGLRNVTGIGSVVGGTNGAAPAWSHFVDLESACANANAQPDMLSGYLLNTKTRGKLKQTQLATNLPFIWQNSDQPVNGYRAAVTNNVPSNLTKGASVSICSSALFSTDWSMTTIGLFGGPDITVDPYSKADLGQVKITLNQFADMQHRQPATVAKIDDLVTG